LKNNLSFREIIALTSSLNIPNIINNNTNKSPVIIAIKISNVNKKHTIPKIKNIIVPIYT
jgi:hypothetical protein